jgi:hypothetical protein
MIFPSIRWRRDGFDDDFDEDLSRAMVSIQVKMRHGERPSGRQPSVATAAVQ